MQRWASILGSVVGITALALLLWDSSYWGTDDHWPVPIEDRVIPQKVLPAPGSEVTAVGQESLVGQPVSAIAEHQQAELRLALIRSSTVSVFLEQAPWVLPDSFHNSDLADSETEEVLQKLAEDSANCLADSAVQYAADYRIPITDFVLDDGTIRSDDDAGSAYAQIAAACIDAAWEAAGITLK